MVHMGGWGWLGIFLGGLFFLLLIVGAVVLVIYAARSSSNPSESGTREIRSEKDRSLEILKERYARGEITRDEFLETRKDLEL